MSKARSRTSQGVPMRTASMVGTLLSVLIVAGLATPAGAATPLCFGKRATKVGTASPDVLRGTPAADVIAGLGGGDTIRGLTGIDRICGGAGADIILAGAGNDFLSGGGGIDLLLGMRGNDVYVGGLGVDLAVFMLSPVPVNVDLAVNSAAGEGSDSLSGIEGAVGSDWNDSLYGDSLLNVLVGGPGNDLLHGRAGSDLVMYTLASAGVTVDLVADTATGGEGTDSLVSIEHAVGSSYDDTLLGTSGANYLIGSEGYDTLDGRGGEDICDGEEMQGCPLVIPTYPDPPPPPPMQVLGPADPEVAPGVPADLIRHARPTVAEDAGGMSCPFPTGSIWLNLPEYSGYGYFEYHLLGGPQVWSPLVWYGGGQWYANFNGQWYLFPGTASYYIGQGSQVNATYWNYWNGQWYSYALGQCITQTMNPGI